MESNSWIPLFERIPASLHDSVALVLTTGSELVMQKLVKLDTDFIILRGRMAGTQDTGRVIVIPYSQLVAVALTRRVSDAELAAMLGQGGSEILASLAAGAESASDADPDEENEASTVSAAAADVNTAGRAAMPSKTMLLAKLRARLGEGKPAGK